MFDCILTEPLFSVLSLQFSTDSVAQHKICVKEHRVRAEKTTQRPLDRTLFVLNIPPYCSEVRLCCEDFQLPISVHVIVVLLASLQKNKMFVLQLSVAK